MASRHQQQHQEQQQLAPLPVLFKQLRRQSALQYSCNSRIHNDDKINTELNNNSNSTDKENNNNGPHSSSSPPSPIDLNPSRSSLTVASYPSGQRLTYDSYACQCAGYLPGYSCHQHHKCTANDCLATFASSLSASTFISTVPHQRGWLWPAYRHRWGYLNIYTNSNLTNIIALASSPPSVTTTTTSASASFY